MGAQASHTFQANKPCACRLHSSRPERCPASPENHYIASCMDQTLGTTLDSDINGPQFYISAPDALSPQLHLPASYTPAGEGLGPSLGLSS